MQSTGAASSAAVPSADVAVPDDDRSGARAWADACSVDGSMRCWIDLDGHGSVGHHSFNAKGTKALDRIEVMLWTASLVLLHHLERRVAWRGVRVLDVSAGTGHLAVGLARLGAHVTATACSPAHDLHAMRALELWVPFLLRQRQDGAAASEAPPYDAGSLGGRVALRQLDWGDDDGGGATEEEAGREFDVVLLSELTCLGEELQPLLVKTLCRILGPSTVAYSILGDHGAFSLGFNWLLSWDSSFVVEELPIDDRLGMREDETLYMYRITRPTPGLSSEELIALAESAHL